MEKRQAVEFLEYLRQDRNLERTIYGDALNMAIEALKAQHSQEGTTSDTISRQATIDAVNNAFDRETLLTGFVRSIAVRAIRDMPTIQPEQCGDKSYTLWKESYEELKRRMDELTSCSDIISRQAAIDALDFEIVHITAYCDGKNVDNPLAQYNKGLEDGKKAIEALPPTQSEPHEGRFERKRDGVFCSVCHYGWEFITGVPAEVEREYHYCPNCGAKMKGE